MNEHIYKAAEESGMWEMLADWTCEFGNCDVEKDSEFLNTFAELLVKECARFVDDYVSDAAGIHYSSGDELKKHFGVKENT